MTTLSTRGRIAPPAATGASGGAGRDSHSRPVAAGNRKAGGCVCGHPWQVHHHGECLIVSCKCKDFTAIRKRQKYNAVRCVGPLGELYDSKAERDYAAHLNSQFEQWSWAPRFVLQDEPLITYRPDFVVWSVDHGLYVADVKGFAARDFSLRVRLWKARYPNVPLVVVKNSEEIWP